MIDFPINPVHGSTYSYLDIQYTFYKPTSTEGYWRVSTPASVGVATPTEINEGTDNAKYVTPQGLDNSEYVREDKTSGETVLNSSSSERLKASGTGVEITGKLVLGGDVEKDGLAVGYHLLYDSDLGTGTAVLSQDWDNFDAVYLVCYLSNSTGGYSGERTSTHLTNRFLTGTTRVSAGDLSGPGSEHARVLVNFDASDKSILTVESSFSAGGTSSAFIREIWGVKHPSAPKI